MKYHWKVLWNHTHGIILATWGLILYIAYARLTLDGTQLTIYNTLINIYTAVSSCVSVWTDALVTASTVSTETTLSIVGAGVWIACTYITQFPSWYNIHFCITSSWRFYYFLHETKSNDDASFKCLLKHACIDTYSKPLVIENKGLLPKNIVAERITKLAAWQRQAAKC